jgi:hypothetical protein
MAAATDGRAVAVPAAPVVSEAVDRPVAPTLGDDDAVLLLDLENAKPGLSEIPAGLHVGVLSHACPLVSAMRWRSRFFHPIAEPREQPSLSLAR